ncbi:hypothetical protein KEM09_15995 [Carboxylicivirga mesophila]|uniref:SD-repeat containing protein B domain-containing protein n=1 Tax=Carboxylicivirga mesophila TaxID=1166478 RepID=A0ABS5KD87_9BACT|nr:SdrD B-like domain-containing protein [Carboxylicivirga mesophila]MBS2212921.1 hypothetical protein [Carboxylicivirga mesophila]
MKKLIYIVFAVLLFASCEADKGVIKGQAEAVNGDEVITSNITVNLYNSDSSLTETTTTNANGEFAFTDLNSGNYYIGATVTVGDQIFDTGNRPQMVYVNDDIVKEVALSLTAK